MSDIISEMKNAIEEHRTEMGDTLGDFKKWYYIYEINENEDDDADATPEEVEDGLNDYVVQELSDFINGYLDDGYTEKQKRFFDCAEFCNALIDEDEYQIFFKPVATKKFSGFEEVSCVDGDTAYMTTNYAKNGENIQCCRTSVNYYIIKKI